MNKKKYMVRHVVHFYSFFTVERKKKLFKMLLSDRFNFHVCCVINVVDLRFQEERKEGSSYVCIIYYQVL